MRITLRPTIVLALAALPLATPAATQQPGGYNVPTIRVSGAGEARARPDEARIQVAVETRARTARAAGEANASATERVIAALVRAGVPRQEIETRGYSLSPIYAPPPRPVEPGPVMDTMSSMEPRISGYQAVNAVSVRTEKLDRVGALIDVALGAGANRLDGIQFALRNSQAAESAALRDAVADARRAAETMATALGVRLGRLLDASTASSPPQFGEMMMRQDVTYADMAQSRPTPIQPGEQTVTATASLVYAIEARR